MADHTKTFAEMLDTLKPIYTGMYAASGVPIYITTDTTNPGGLSNGQDVEPTKTPMREIDNSALDRKYITDVSKVRRKIRERYTCDCGSKSYRLDWCKGYYLATCRRDGCTREYEVPHGIAYGK